MREIKFRAWDKYYKTMCKVDVLTNKGAHLVGLPVKAKSVPQGNRVYVEIPAKQRFRKNHQIILMQFTGLKDKNAKEIYGEGDIYKDADGVISIVQMAVDGWALFPVKKGTPVRNLYWHNICDKTKGEVIGNIHENPELLEANSV